MKTSIPSLTISIIILFMSIIVLPTYFIGIIQWRDDVNTAQAAGRNYIDAVIDNKQISDKATAELNLDLASCSTSFSYTVTREEKVVNPSKTSVDGETESIWVYADIDKDTKWHSGDIITIHIKQEGTNIFQTIAMTLLGASFNPVDITMSAMVR